MPKKVINYRWIIREGMVMHLANAKVALYLLCYFGPCYTKIFDELLDDVEIGNVTLDQKAQELMGDSIQLKGAGMLYKTTDLVRNPLALEYPSWEEVKKRAKKLRDKLREQNRNNQMGGL